MVKIRCSTRAGGAVVLNTQAQVRASYGVHSDILYSSAKLPDGSNIQFFLNRATGLVVVDHIHKGGRGGVELMRRHII